MQSLKLIKVLCCIFLFHCLKSIFCIIISRTRVMFKKNNNPFSGRDSVMKESMRGMILIARVKIKKKFSQIKI